MIDGTPTGFALKRVFDEHLQRIQEAIINGDGYSKIPPLDIVVLTDGVPSKFTFSHFEIINLTKSFARS